MAEAISLLSIGNTQNLSITQVVSFDLSAKGSETDQCICSRQNAKFAVIYISFASYTDNAGSLARTQYAYNGQWTILGNTENQIKVILLNTDDGTFDFLAAYMNQSTLQLTLDATGNINRINRVVGSILLYE